MSRAQRAATALNDLHLFDEEDQANLQEVALDYFTAPFEGLNSGGFGGEHSLL